MSFNTIKKVVEEGDTVMLYLGKQSLMTIQIDSTKTHQTKFGAFPHKDIIGKTFGTKIYSKNGKGWIFLLHPSPELWTVTLPHRTQILYSTDISLITHELELKPGSVVVESGTGSGSLSHAIIRTIKPNGHLYTFDFHQQRVEKAREEFDSHGIGEYVTTACADACKDGYGLENKADAVFLDLPAPWDAISHAKITLKKSGGRLCSFSPCIEQVQRTCDVLRVHRFCEIKTVGCLLRILNVRTIAVPEANLGPSQIKNFSDKGSTESKCEHPELKRLKTDDSVQIDKDEKETKEIEEHVSERNEATQRTFISDSNQTIKNSNGLDTVTGINSKGMVSKVTAKEKLGHINVLTSKGNKEIPGHTGYLTFASLYPCWRKSSEK